MFRTLIYPSSEACDCSVILPHWSIVLGSITTNVVIQQNSRKLLMMDKLVSEACWAHKKWNKITSDIKLVFYFSTIFFCTSFGVYNFNCYCTGSSVLWALHLDKERIPTCGFAHYEQLFMLFRFLHAFRNVVMQFGECKWKMSPSHKKCRLLHILTSFH